MGNIEWEYQNQETLKAWYQEKISGKNPNLAVRRIICKGYRKELSQLAREARKDRVCKVCGKVFTPTRSDDVYCSNACRQKAYRKSVTDNQVVTKNTCLSVTEQNQIATCERS